MTGRLLLAWHPCTLSGLKAMTLPGPMTTACLFNFSLCPPSVSCVLLMPEER